MSPIHLTSRTLAGAGFAHAFSLREAGDFALLRDRTRLHEAQDRLGHAIGFARASLHQTIQVHGREVAIASGDPDSLVTTHADAIVGEPGSGHAVAVRVADCVPVLVADPESGGVAAIHAGWRGVEARVIEAAIAKLEGSTARLVVAIGPCIGACCFEVGADVAERIAIASSPQIVARRDGDKAFVDLRLAVRRQLGSLGVSDGAIDDVPGRGREGCTRCDADRYHSFRRDGDASGRLLGVIVAR